MAESASPTFLRSLRVLCGALMFSLICILLAVAAALGKNGTGSTPLWAFGLVIALGVVAAAAIPLIGYRVTPIAPGTAEDEARSASARALQSTTVLRFALAESVAIVSVALAFVVDAGGLYLGLVGVAISETLLLLHVWPGEQVISRVQERLESQGARSYLREALDAPPPVRSRVSR